MQLVKKFKSFLTYQIDDPYALTSDQKVRLCPSKKFVLHNSAEKESLYLPISCLKFPKTRILNFKFNEGTITATKKKRKL